MNGEKICNWAIRVGFALLFILIPLILTPWNYELFEYNKMTAAYGITALIVTAWVIRMIQMQKITVAKTPFDIPIGLFFLSQLISTIFSMDPHISWFGYYSRFNGGLSSTITYILLYYACVSNKDILRAFLPTLLKVSCSTAVVVASYGIAEHFGIDKNIWVQDVQSRVFSTLGQPNWLAAYLIACIPVAWAMSLGVKNRETRIRGIIGLTLSGLFFLTLLYTRSRSGLLAFTITDILFWGILAAPYWPLIIRRSKLGVSSLFDAFRRSWLFIPLVTCHVILFILVFFTGTNIDRIDRWFTAPGWKNVLVQITSRKPRDTSAPAQTQNAEDGKSATAPAAEGQSEHTGDKPAGPLLETGGTESGTIRKYVWEAALIAWRSSVKTFLIGTGTETFAFAFYQFKPVGHNLTSEWDFLYNKAHNEYLNYLATTGILGLGTYLFFIGSVIYFCFKFQIFNLKFSIKISNFKFQIEDTQEDKIDSPNVVLLGIFCGWVSILITNFFGFSVVIIQIMFFLIPAVFIILQQNSDEIYLVSLPLPWQKMTVRYSTAATLFVFAGVLFVILRLWYADTLFASGYHLARANQIVGAYEGLTRAAVINPWEPFYRDERSSVLATLAVAAAQEQEATLAAQLSGSAIAENDFALSVSPRNVNFWKTRTKVFFALSTLQPDYLTNAIDAINQAISLAPNDPKLTYNLSVLYGRIGETEKGIAILKKTIALKPNYRDAYNALAVFYNETNRPDLARQTAQEYLNLVDPNDEAFKKMAE